MKKTAKYTVYSSNPSDYATGNEVHGNPADIVKVYEIDYETSKQLKADYEEARKIWSEYYIVCDADGFSMTDPMTFSEEFLLRLHEEHDENAHEFDMF
jgi:hypothetical protein